MATKGSGVTVAEANRVLNYDKDDIEAARRLLSEAVGLSAVSIRILQSRITKHK